MKQMMSWSCVYQPDCDRQQFTLRDAQRLFRVCQTNSVSSLIKLYNQFHLSVSVFFCLFMYEFFCCCGFVSLYVILHTCAHQVFYGFHMPACSCVYIFVEVCVNSVQTRKKVGFSISFCPQGLAVTWSTDLILCCQGDALSQRST